MTETPKPMTKTGLLELTEFPDVHRKAIEHAIWEGVDRDDPEDTTWPDYFRGEEVLVQLDCEISATDELSEREYISDALWFASGWKAALRAMKGLKAPPEADPELLVDIEITNPEQADKLLPPTLKSKLSL